MPIATTVVTGPAATDIRLSFDLVSGRVTGWTCHGLWPYTGTKTKTLDKVATRNRMQMSDAMS